MVSCGPQLTERLYESKDETTGGFNKYSLDLKSNGKLALKLESSKTITLTDSTSQIENLRKTVLGKWSVGNNVINYSLNDSISSIDSFWVKTDFASNIGIHNCISFTSKLDTAIIYGIPCSMIVVK